MVGEVETVYYFRKLDRKWQIGIFEDGSKEPIKVYEILVGESGAGYCDCPARVSECKHIRVLGRLLEEHGDTLDQISWAYHLEEERFFQAFNIGSIVGS